MVNRIGGVMVSMITASAVDRRFELRLGQIKPRGVTHSTGFLHTPDTKSELSINQF
jgi:hypothetical protein